MINKIKKYIFLVAILVVVVVLGFYLGVKLSKHNGRTLDDKVVAFRIGIREKLVDYDLKAMLSYLKCKYEKEGYEVREFAYAGDLYPKRLDNAGVNLFVRGDFVPFDKRVNEKAHNIYFVQRFVGGYIEEFRNFDEYLSIQEPLIVAAKANGVEVGYLEGGSCKNKNLATKDAKNIIYIYEEKDASVINRVSKIRNAKIYSTIDFAELEEKEKIAELEKARMVVFDRDLKRLPDKKYVPYAVYELIGYGKKVITNSHNGTKLPDGVMRFSDVNEMIYLMEKY
jgi:hypothetical protein